MAWQGGKKLGNAFYVMFYDTVILNKALYHLV